VPHPLTLRACSQAINMMWCPITLDSHTMYIFSRKKTFYIHIIRIKSVSDLYNVDIHFVSFLNDLLFIDYLVIKREKLKIHLSYWFFVFLFVFSEYGTILEIRLNPKVQVLFFVTMSSKCDTTILKWRCDHRRLVSIHHHIYITAIYAVAN